jgi:HEAT repeat protein
MNTTRDPFIRAQAARGLGLIGDQDAVPSLAQVLSNPGAPLPARHEAATALGRLGGEEAELALSLAFSDPRASIVEAAWEAYHALLGRRST